MDRISRNVAVVSSRLEARHETAAMLFRLGIEPVCVSTVHQFEALSKHELGLIFCDRDLKDGDFHDVLSASSSDSERTPVFVMMGEPETPDGYEMARRSGVFEVIAAPCRPADVEWMVILARRYWQNLAHSTGEAGPSVAVLCKAAGAGV